jgi:hypothetical protein
MKDKYLLNWYFHWIVLYRKFFCFLSKDFYIGPNEKSLLLSWSDSLFLCRILYIFNLCNDFDPLSRGRLIIAIRLIHNSVYPFFISSFVLLSIKCQEQIRRMHCFSLRRPLFRLSHVWYGETNR